MTFATAEQRESVEQQGHSEPNRQRRGRLWLAAFVVFIIQIGFIYWFGSRSMPVPEKPPFSPTIQLSPSGAEELLALQDPTLFALPHRENFSGEAWLRRPQQTFEPKNWTEPTLPLELPPQQLGATFAVFMQTNPAPRFEASIGSEPDLELAPAPIAESISTPSTLRIEGDLAKRPLLAAISLPPQTNADLLLNTEVQLLVNAEGIAHSAVVMPPGSGRPDVDQMALALAKSARFEPLKPQANTSSSAPQTTFGKLIFEWQTLPPAATNAPASGQ